MSNKNLIYYLKTSKILKNPLIEHAMQKIDRKNFIPINLHHHSYIDSALPIGEKQTISQPTTVVFMLENLKLKKGIKVLEIGSGSGWVLALLSVIVGDKGYVYGYEIDKPTGKFGLNNLNKYNLENLQYEISDYKNNYLKHAPFDRIIVSAAFTKIPNNLINSLNNNGILIAPTQDGYIRKITKLNSKVKEEKFYGFLFVPIQH